MQIPLSQLDLPARDLRASVDEDALDELVASLRDHGQLQSIGVIQKEDQRYEVVFGARRTRAARLLQWENIRGDLVDPSTLANSDAKKLIENVQRLDMTPIEEAYGLLDLIGDGPADVRALQLQTGKSKEWIRSRLDLAAMPDDLQGAVQAGVLSVGVARIFATIEHPLVREQYIRSAIDSGCTVDQARVWAGQAVYAAQGIMTMDDIRTTAGEQLEPAAGRDLIHHCFICAEAKNWKRTNTLIVCADCQDAIAEARTPATSHGTHPPIESENIV